MTLTSSSTGTLPATGYSGSVDWGDGSTTDAALFGSFASQGLVAQPVNTLIVNGPDHTYKTPGTYSITVSVMGPGDSAPTVYRDTASISLGINGQLNRTSDSGYFNNDNVTAVRTPNFIGSTEAGATVVLTATSLQGGQSVVVGTGVADASGAWSITTVPFVDGTYSIIAKATDASGNSASAVVAGRQSLFSTNFLEIAAAGPKVTSFQVINARTGTFQVGLSDFSGLFVGPLTDPASYAVTRSLSSRTSQNLSVANLTLTPPATSTIGNAPPIAPTATVTGRLNNGKALANGVYTFTVHSAGIINLAGTALDGTYTGKLPSGNGHPGSDFQVKVTVRNGKPSGPIAVTPVKVKALALAKHHA